jgi:hypothetical protein
MLTSFPTGVVKHIFPPHIEAQRAALNALDPMLVGFEEYLLKKLRPSDVCKDNQGVYMFNVNRVAYLVEESESKDQQRVTQRRIKDAVTSINVTSKKCPSSGRGKTALFLFVAYIDRQTDSKTWDLFSRRLSQDRQTDSKTWDLFSRRLSQDRQTDSKTWGSF